MLLKARDLNLTPQVAFNFSDLDQQCEAYLRQVREEAEALLAQAAIDAAELRRQAHAEGLAAGQREGLEAAHRQLESRAAELADSRIQERLNTALPALQAAVSALQTEREAWLRSWEAAAVRLCAAIAERIVKREIALRPDVAPQLIAEALQLAAGSPQMRIRVHPDDIAHLKTCGHALFNQLASLGDTSLVPDLGITRGGCLIETLHGSIDAQIETQIQRIVDELLANSS